MQIILHFFRQSQTRIPVYGYCVYGKHATQVRISFVKITGAYELLHFFLFHIGTQSDNHLLMISSSIIKITFLGGFMIVWLPRTCHKRTCRLVIFDCFSVEIIIPEWLWSKNSVLFLLPLLRCSSETIHRQ